MTTERSGERSEGVAFPFLVVLVGMVSALAGLGLAIVSALLLVAQVQRTATATWAVWVVILLCGLLSVGLLQIARRLLVGRNLHRTLFSPIALYALAVLYAVIAVGIPYYGGWSELRPAGIMLGLSVACFRLAQRKRTS